MRSTQKSKEKLQSCGLLSTFKKFRTISLVIYIIIFSLATVSGKKNVQAGSHQPEWETNYRLSSLIRPIEYDLLLHPDLDTGKFSGEVTITINIKAVRKFIAVHTKLLDIYQTHLTDANNRIINVRAFEYKPNEFWVIQGSRDFAPGLYQLHFKFRGNLKGKLVGFYTSVYFDKKSNKIRKIATSKFEPTYARQAFPCFDEPSFKPTFKISLVRPSKGYTALSNMHVIKTLPDTPSPGLTTVSFAVSVKMVTYLACFIISNFKAHPPVWVDTPGNKFPVAVYGTPSQVESGKTDYALKTCVKVVKYFSKYFDIAYPLPKLDMVAIPDYASGATEHWGLITYREATLLYSKDFSSTSNKQTTGLIIAHELGHMWFGNLVTLTWWNDLWLNEGFASFVQYKGCDHAHRSWSMPDQFLINHLQTVLEVDAKQSSHPIVVRVDDPDQITALFDIISYHKGASVIRMLEDFLGPKPFQKGIQNFLKKYQFKNAVTQDLWDIFQEVADPSIDITSIMNTWTRQMGYPIVTVERLTDNTYLLTQERFLSNPESKIKDVSPFNYKWDIPITYTTNLQPEVVQEAHRAWMPRSGKSIKITVPKNAHWVKFNARQVGYYRVNYGYDHWNSLIEVLIQNLEEFPVADRSHLIDDVFSIADSGLVDYSVALDLSMYLQNEYEFVPWLSGSMKLLRLRNNLAKTSILPALEAYVQNLVSDTYEDVTWDVMSKRENNKHLFKRLRVTVLELACTFGLKKCRKEAGKLFAEWIQHPEKKPHPDLRNLIYSHGLVSAGDESSWNKMWNIFIKEEDSQEKTKLMYGLAAIQNDKVLHRYIDYARNEKYVRSQDFFMLLGYIAENPVGNDIVWDFMRNEWEYLVNRFTLNSRAFGGLITKISASFATTEKLQEMKAFFADYPNAGAGELIRKQALESVSDRIRWMEINVPSIRYWFGLEESIKD